MTKRAFGELESQIFFILKSGERKTVKEVQKALGGLDNYNTVMTVMSRLAEKKLLARERVGLHYEYWLLPSTTSSSFVTALKRRLFAVAPSLLVSHLVEAVDDLSEEDLAEMEKLVQKARAARK